MSAEFQAYFPQAPVRMRLEKVEPGVPRKEMEARVAEARARAAEELHQQYEAQIADMRSEAVAFHQQLLGRVHDAVTEWTSDWERQVPELVLAGVRAVLSDFQLSDEQLAQWVERALREAGVNERSELEIRLSEHNAERLEAFWKTNDIRLPESCFVTPVAGLSDVDCRVVGRSGILDASLPVRLSQLRRLWKLAP